MPARRLALEVIRAVTEQGAYLSLVLDEKLHACTLSEADRRFASRLAYDTIDRLMTIDYALEQVMARPDTDLRLRNVLRLGACQLLMLDRVPANAACDTSVRLCREIGLDPLSGVCNGILRNLVRKKEAGELREPESEEDPLRVLSLRCSVPEWLAGKLTDDWGAEEAARLMNERGHTGVITVRPNLLRVTDEGFEAVLAKKVWKHEKGLLPHTWHVTGALDIGADNDFKNGVFSIQGEGSVIACLAVDPQRGQTVLDACAAPGGKACLLSEMMGDTGRVQAWELHPHRTALIEAQIKRLRLDNVRPMTRDALVRRENLIETMDAVLLDAPCSGTGDMADKPDVKYRVTEDSLRELTATQAALLDRVSEYVRPGGTLVYSTCSVLRDENERQVTAFLQRHPEFTLAPLPATVPESLRQYEKTGLQLLPERDGVGGFYVCRMRRKRA